MPSEELSTKKWRRNTQRRRAEQNGTAEEKTRKWRRDTQWWKAEQNGGVEESHARGEEKSMSLGTWEGMRSRVIEDWRMGTICIARKEKNRRWEVMLSRVRE